MLDFHKLLPLDEPISLGRDIFHRKLSHRRSPWKSSGTEGLYKDGKALNVLLLADDVLLTADKKNAEKLVKQTQRHVKTIRLKIHGDRT